MFPADNENNQAVDLVKQDVVLLNDRLRNLQGTLDTLVKYGPTADVRNFAENGTRQLDLIVRDTETLMGSMLTALDIVKQQRDDALEEIDYTAEESYDMGYAAAQEDNAIGDDDLTDAYNEGSNDELHHIEDILGMSVEEAKQHIEEADATLAEWEQWAQDAA